MRTTLKTVLSGSVATRPHALVVLMAGFAIACGSGDEKKPETAWACQSTNVPLGAAVECTGQTQQKLLAMAYTDFKATATSTDGTSDGTYTYTNDSVSGSTSGTGTTSPIGAGSTTTGTGGTGTSTGGTTGTDTSGTGTTSPIGAGSTTTTTGGTSADGSATIYTSLGLSTFTTSDGITGTVSIIDGIRLVQYECPAGTTSLLCPTFRADTYSTSTGGTTASGSGYTDTVGSGGTTGGTGATGTGSGSGTGGTGTGSGSGSGSGTGTGSGSGSGTGGTSGAGGSGGGGGGASGLPGAGVGSGGGGGGGAGGLAPECQYGPDLSYCGTPASSDGTSGTGGTGAGGTGGDTTGGTTGGTGTGSTDGSTTNGNGNGGTNGNGSGSGSGSGTGGDTYSSDGTSGGNGNGNGGVGNGGSNGKGNGSNKPGSGTSTTGKGNPKGSDRPFTCVRTDDGTTTCRSKNPDCVAGAKPAACGACVPNTSDGSDCAPTALGGCWITGGGWTPVAQGGNGKVTFGGNGKPMKDGRIQGEWNHVDHGTGGHVHGQVRYLVCRHVDEPGPGMPGGNKNFNDNQAYFGGPARYTATNGTMAEGYWFDVFVEDHGEPGNKPGPGNHGSKGPDEYRITVRQQVDLAKQQSGTIVYSAPLSGLGGGNIQLHPPNGGHPATKMSLPQWVSFED